MELTVSGRHIHVLWNRWYWGQIYGFDSVVGEYVWFVEIDGIWRGCIYMGLIVCEGIMIMCNTDRVLRAHPWFVSLMVFWKHSCGLWHWKCLEAQPWYVSLTAFCRYIHDLWNWLYWEAYKWHWQCFVGISMIFGIDGDLWNWLNWEAYKCHRQCFVYIFMIYNIDSVWTAYPWFVGWLWHSNQKYEYSSSTGQRNIIWNELPS